MPASPTYDRIALDVSSVPLSESIVVGRPRCVSRSASSRATRLAEIDVSATATRHSRVTSFTTFSTPKAPAPDKLVVDKVDASAVGQGNYGQRRVGANGAPS